MPECKLITKEQKEAADHPGATGFYGSRVPSFAPKFLDTSAEKVLRNPSDTAHIVLGKDRKSIITSGYGAQADPNSAAIDLVVGRGAGLPCEKKQEALDGGGVNVDMYHDAARIYISQKSDPDKYFGLTKGYISKSSSIGVSTVAIKADAVRIMGRQGIKLVTHSDKKNSQGKERYPFEGIDLIAGNTNRGLQSLVKGENLKKCLEEMFEIIGEVRNLSWEIGDMVDQLAQDLAKHKHVPSPPAGTGPSPTMIKHVIIEKLVYGKLFLKFQQNAKRCGQARAAYLKAPGDKNYICSQYNNTN